MKMPLYLKLVDVCEPNQLQPSLVPSLSLPKPITYTNTSKPGRLFAITDKNQIIFNHDWCWFQLQSSVGAILPSPLVPLHQEEWEGKGSCTDPPELGGDTPPRESLQTPAEGRPVITLGIKTVLQDRKKPKGASHDSDEIGSCWSYPVTDNTSKS